MPSSACDWSSDVCSSDRSEEHTSELQSRSDLVCRLLLEKKKSHVRAHKPSTELGDASELYIISTPAAREYDATDDRDYRHNGIVIALRLHWQYLRRPHVN